MRKYTDSYRAVALSGLLLVSACMNGKNLPDLPPPEMAVDVKTSAVAIALSERESVAAVDPAAESFETLLEARAIEYDTVFKEAANRGAIAGAVRGGLIGLLIAGNPEGAFAGALLGSAVGAAVAEHAASELVMEHQNYIIRRWSLDKVIEAARNDTQNTRFDLLLSQQALANARKTDSFTKQTSAERSITLLSDFRKYAEIRALSLREVIPLYRDDQTATDTLIGELKAQIHMIKQIEANVQAIEGD